MKNDPFKACSWVIFPDAEPMMSDVAAVGVRAAHVLGAAGDGVLGADLDVAQVPDRSLQKQQEEERMSEAAQEARLRGSHPHRHKHDGKRKQQPQASESAPGSPPDGPSSPRRRGSPCRWGCTPPSSSGSARRRRERAADDEGEKKQGPEKKDVNQFIADCAFFNPVLLRHSGAGALSASSFFAVGAPRGSSCGGRAAAGTCPRPPRAALPSSEWSCARRGRRSPPGAAGRAGGGTQPPRPRTRQAGRKKRSWRKAAAAPHAASSCRASNPVAGVGRCRHHCCPAQGCR